MKKDQSQADAIHDGEAVSLGADNAISTSKSIRWQEWLFATALVAAVFAAYHPAWHGSYLWDDNDHLLDNPVLGPGGLAKVWVPGGYLNYWPLTYTVYRIEYQLWGLEPLGFHLFNIAVHCISALLVWRILKRLLVPGAMLAAAIFVLHPVNVESVAWIAQLKGLLSVALALTSLLLYLIFEKQGGKCRYALALFAFLLSALAKGEVLTLPIVLLALAWWQRGRIDRRDVLRIIPYFIIAACMAGLEIWTQALLESPTIRTDDIFSRFATAGCAVWFYFWKIFWPVNLIPNYPRWTIDSRSVLSYVPAALLIVALAIAWRWRGSWSRPIVVLIVCYVALLLPVLGFVNIYFMRYSFVADHWQYVATIVPCAFFAGICATLARRLRCPLTAFGAAAALLVLLGVLDWRQSRTYASSEAFYKTTIERNPESWFAHYNLGETLGGQGRFDEAITQFEAALKIRPADVMAHDGLAQALFSVGRADAAIDQYQRALAIDARDADAEFGLGNIAASRGELDAAIEHFQKSVAIKPNYALAQNNLGNALFHRGQDALGIAHLKKALEINPNLVAANYNLAEAMISRGQLDSAIAYYQQVVAIKPDFVECQFKLGSLLARRGEYDTAIEHYHQVLKFRPNDSEAFRNLNAAKSLLQKAVNALAETRELISLHPNNASLLNLAAWTLATNPNASIRNGAEAVELAERASKLSGGSDPAILGTLAAAYAEAGRFSDAIRAAGVATRLATVAGNRPLAEENRIRKKLYESGKPYRQLLGQ